MGVYGRVTVRGAMGRALVAKSGLPITWAHVETAWLKWKEGIIRDSVLCLVGDRAWLGGNTVHSPPL